MSEIKVNKISPRTNCGTVTLGDSGDTIAIGAGVTTSGMGRAGAVDWQTTIKTGDFTAVSGEGYFVNTTSGEIDVTLPSSPSAGDIVAVSDYAQTFDTNNCIMLRNGSNIEGAASDLTLDAEGLAMTFVYADSTKGWKVVGAGREADATEVTFLTATGGNSVTECGDCKIHTFTGPGTFTVSQVASTAAENLVSYLIVAGGGSGGAGCSGGGGGAGGFREVKTPLTPYSASPLCGYGTPGNRVTVTAQAYPIVVGAGGAGTPPFTMYPSVPPVTVPENPGVASSFGGISSAGGGYGGGTCSVNAGNGGSGGGGGHNAGTGGSGNTPPVTPAQGKDGRTSAPATGPAPSDAAGGGGGATTIAQAAPAGHAGGDGAQTGITGSAVTYAGGGGGSNRCGGSSSDTAGGPGGGGRGGFGPRPTPASDGEGKDGTANTGGGGGGGKALSPAPACRPQGGAGSGGSGIVVIRYKFK
jgi:hypothetical protein